MGNVVNTCCIKDDNDTPASPNTNPVAMVRKHTSAVEMSIDGAIQRALQKSVSMTRVPGGTCPDSRQHQRPKLNSHTQNVIPHAVNFQFANYHHGFKVVRKMSSVSNLSIRSKVKKIKKRQHFEVDDDK
jgi:hypothetical protein